MTDTKDSAQRAAERIVLGDADGVFVLMFYGCDEAECFGVTRSRRLAQAWEDADFMHKARKFQLEEIDIPIWVRDKKLHALLAKGGNNG